MIKNIIFDLGNVLFEFNPEKITSAFTQDENEKKMIVDVIFHSKEWTDLNAGRITNEEAIEIYKNKLPQNLHSLVDMIMENWMDFIYLDDRMLDIAKCLKRNGYKIFILSNAPVSFDKWFKEEKKEFADIFDGIVISAIEKQEKPNADIFNTILNRYNLNKEECFFIDDREENIEGAKKCGISGYCYNMNNLKGLLDTFKEKNIEI